VQTYSGKEIFRVLLSRIHDVPGQPPTSEPELDLAKSVAQWQVDNRDVPEEISLLKSALKQRVGI
jgi:hypothetical protein